jgi:dTDP-glucose 4,6-dehydratase
MVTGGCGFIGSNFIRMLDRDGYGGLVVNVDSLTYAGNKENLKDIGLRGYTFFNFDIANASLMDTAFAKTRPDIVVNFAAESHVDRSIDGAAAFVRTNVVGTQVMLDMALRYGVSKFVQVGTDEVYGDLGPDGIPATEDGSLKPSSPYSASKTAADLLALSYVRTHKMDVSVTRCSNNYGPYQFPEKLIPLMVTKAMNGERLPVYAEGLQVRDWIHVLDHCRGILRVVDGGRPGEVYNFGGDCELRNIDVVKEILKATGRGEDLIDHVEDRKGHDFRYAIDFSKAEGELGWRPTVKWETGISETIAWYRDNEDWWLPLKG